MKSPWKASPGPAAPADFMWIREELPSQSFLACQTHKIVNKINGWFKLLNLGNSLLMQWNTYQNIEVLTVLHDAKEKRILIWLRMSSCFSVSTEMKEKPKSLFRFELPYFHSSAGTNLLPLGKSREDNTAIPNIPSQCLKDLLWKLWELPGCCLPYVRKPTSK